MNVNPPKGEWQQFRDGQWGKLSDVDLAATVELVGRLQKWYQKAEGDVAPANEGAAGEDDGAVTTGRRTIEPHGGP